MALQFGNVFAAPSTAEDLETRAAGEALDVKPGAVAGSGQLPAMGMPKAVELLLQMQDGAPAGNQGAAKAASELPLKAGLRATATGSRPAAAQNEDQGPLDDLRKSILGGGDPQGDRLDGEGRRRQQEESQRYDVERGDQTSSGSRSMSSAGNAGGGSSILEWPVIRFIRENRALVLGVCLAALVGAWAAANLRFHRTRR